MKFPNRKLCFPHNFLANFLANFSLNFLTKLLINLFFIQIFLTFFCSEIFAWSGYDYDQKTEIDIGTGNLVREGMMIQFYDTKDDNFHTAKVISIQSVAGGTELKVTDLDIKKERTFVMYD